MKPKFQLLLLICSILFAGCIQKGHPPFRKMGDYAPPLRIHKWLKGTSVKNFEEGKVYVVEFWATWCKPCMAAMPHLSSLAREYRDKVDVIAIDIYEDKGTSIERVNAFVDSVGNLMDFRVAVQDSNLMVDNWLIASGEKNNGIPRTFVIDAEGKVAWIGYPSDLDKVLPKIVNGTWDIKEDLSKRAANKHLDSLDNNAVSKVLIYVRKYVHIRNPYIDNPEDLEKPDSALLVIDEIVRKEPKLKYAPFITFYTFSALLKTNPNKAYEFGKKAIVTPTHQNAAYSSIIEGIEYYSDRLKIPTEIYRLGAEAYQKQIDQVIYPQLEDIPSQYRKMAVMYRRAGDKSKALEARQKAIKLDGNNISSK